MSGGRALGKSQYEEYIRRDFQMRDHPHLDEVKYPVLGMKAHEDYGNHGCAISWCQSVSFCHGYRYTLPRFDQYLMFVAATQISPIQGRRG